MGETAGPQALDHLLASASASVTEEDVAEARQSSENMQREAENLDMLQYRMFAADGDPG